MKTQFTTAAYVRSHGKEPKGKGYWMLCQSRTHSAYDADLDLSNIIGFNGTIGEVKRLAVQSGMTGIIAIMP